MQNVMHTTERPRVSGAPRPSRHAGRRAGVVRAITVRNLPADLSAELARLRRERRLSLNQLVIQLLAERLGMAGRAASGQRPPDELDQLAGAWRTAEADVFDHAVAEVRRVDDELWR